MLQIRNLTKMYDEIIINNLSVDFPSVGMVVIVGESGCGKTSLLNIIGGLDNDYQGSIIFDGKDIRNIKDYCRNHIGFVFQNFNLINWLNGKENYVLPGKFTGILAKRVLKDKEEKLELKNLKKKINTFSGGQKQRIALLRVMAKNTDILLCDEPTGSLDNENAVAVFKMLKQESKERLVIVISHDNTLALEYGDYLYKMKQGRLQGKKTNIKKENFYFRLKEKYSFKHLLSLSFLQYLANISRNLKITAGIVLAILCIMITFTLSDSLQQQITKQLNNIFGSQLVSFQTKNRSKLLYQDLLSLKDYQDSCFVYGEPLEYEFIGLSLKDNYDIDKSVYISDMTKTVTNSNLQYGTLTSNSDEIVLSKTTARHLLNDYKELINSRIYGFYLYKDEIKVVSLKIVGITNEITAFDTIYLNEFGNLEQISQIYNKPIESIKLQLGLINLNSSLHTNKIITKLNNHFNQLEFKLAGKDISNKINNLLNQVKQVLLLFSSLAIVSACFLIGEVLYLSVVERTKDIGIYKCLGASKFQIMVLVLLESFITIISAYIMALVLLLQIVSFINNELIKLLEVSITGKLVVIDYRILLIIFIGTTIFSMISSFFPANVARKIDTIKALSYHSY